MTVDVDLLKDRFVTEMANKYNQEMFFIESCLKHSSHADNSLRIFFEENNKMISCGKEIKFYDKCHPQKLTLNKIH